MWGKKRLGACAVAAGIGAGGLTVASHAATPPERVSGASEPGVTAFHQALDRSLAEQDTVRPQPQPAAPDRDTARLAKTASAFTGRVSADDARARFAKATPSLVIPGALVPKAAEVQRILAPTALRVDGPGGKGSQVMVSNMPIAVRDPDTASGFRLADLGWAATGDDRFAVSRPVRSVSAPDTAGGLVRVGDGADAFSLRLSDATSSARGVLKDESIVYANASEDTDLIVRSLPTGVGVGWSLRSPAAKHDLSVPITLPAGTKLQKTTLGDVRIVDQQNQLVSEITAAFATDAEGQSVPLTTTVSGSTVTWSVDHQAGKVAYPVTVDPNFYEAHWDQDASQSFAGWHAQNAPKADGPFFFVDPAMVDPKTGKPSGELGVFAPPGNQYEQISSGTWAHFAPGNPNQGEFENGRRVSPEHARWTKFVAGGLGFNYVPTRLVHYFNAPNNDVVFANRDGKLDESGTFNKANSDGSDGLQITGNAHGQLGNSTSGQIITLNAGAQATHDNALGFDLRYDTNNNYRLFDHPQAAIAMDWYRAYATDDVAPQPAVTPNDNWLGLSGTVAAHATDNGLGVHYLSLQKPDGTTLGTGVEMPCPAVGPEVCPFDTGTKDLPVVGAQEGITTQYVTATDAAGSGDPAQGHFARSPFTLKYDIQPPTIQLGGSMHDGVASPMPDGTEQTVTVHAEDGNPTGTSDQQRSGVQRVEVYADGQLVASADQGTPGDSQPLDVSWTPAAGGPLDGPGGHIVEAVAIDRLGHESYSAFTVHRAGLSATGELRDMQNEFSDGTSSHVVEAKAASEGSGIASETLQVDGQIKDTAAADCSSGCPATLDSNLRWDASTATEGQHTIAVEATRQNAAPLGPVSWTVSVDRTAPAPPTGLRLDFDRTRGKAQLALTPGVDPQMPDGHAGSGASMTAYRVQQAGVWSDWQYADIGEAIYVTGTAGSQVTLEAETMDAEGNASSATPRTLTVGAGPSPDKSYLYDACPATADTVAVSCSLGSTITQFQSSGSGGSTGQRSLMPASSEIPFAGVCDQGNDGPDDQVAFRDDAYHWRYNRTWQAQVDAGFNDPDLPPDYKRRVGEVTDNVHVAIKGRQFHFRPRQQVRCGYGIKGYAQAEFRNARTNRKLRPRATVEDDTYDTRWVGKDTSVPMYSPHIRAIIYFYGKNPFYRDLVNGTKPDGDFRGSKAIAPVVDKVAETQPYEFGR